MTAADGVKRTFPALAIAPVRNPATPQRWSRSTKMAAADLQGQADADETVMAERYLR